MTRDEIHWLLFDPLGLGGEGRENWFGKVILEKRYVECNLLNELCEGKDLG